jgi:hypothetical protein
MAKTYFAAREIESTEKERLIKQKVQLEEELAQTRRQAFDLIKPEMIIPIKIRCLPLSIAKRWICHGN